LRNSGETDESIKTDSGSIRYCCDFFLQRYDRGSHQSGAIGISDTDTNTNSNADTDTDTDADSNTAKR
jgi:hypothetical protein